jgi:hypothetical protein
MSSPHLELQLNLVEQQFDEVSCALLDADPAAFQQACAGLQQTAVDFIQLSHHQAPGGVLPADMAQRVKALAEALPLLREGLYRKAALVERALPLLVPSTEQPSTYAGDSAPYASAMRQSGAFRGVAA